MFRPMFVAFKFSLLEIQVSDYFKTDGKLSFKFSISDFHSIKPGLSKYVLLVWMGHKRNLPRKIPRVILNPPPLPLLSDKY